MNRGSYYIAACLIILIFRDFLSPVYFKEISQDEGYRDGQIGKVHLQYIKLKNTPAPKFPELDDAQLVMCRLWRATR